MLTDSDGDETGSAAPATSAAAAPAVACVSPTPAALDALRSPRALPPAKRPRGAGAGGAGGAATARGATPPQNTLSHFFMKSA